MDMKLKTLNFKQTTSQNIPKKEFKEIEVVEKRIKITDEIPEENHEFWAKSANYTREERKASIADENFGHNDLSEWAKL